MYLAFQFLVPLRHFLYPGNVNWTEEGHRFSWHMLLRTKRGFAHFYAYDPTTGLTYRLDPLGYLSYEQARDLAGHPDMILQFAHFLANHPKIREAATVGKRDARLGEVLVAFVVLDAGATLREDEFFDYCKTEMVKYKRPVEVGFVDALPKTGTNKINRRALRERV